MKIFSYVFIVLAAFLCIYNVTKLNFDNILQGDSLVALVGVLASLCAIMIVLIFLTSKKIQEKINNSKK
ncbi:hypothetical protein KORDIASMS9_01364 [Kordia sp. SMS9]|uniref:hypothetical protein n=1 Tax=Kordia sp. SMS9 TaxID=2282170 RepID=UPI000E0D497B|nr:hypothetical protein [Kordia sp. SMS9]AXG69145.1 hypothetical protein KORDIASMS9_01364 [Kordia sp. SMS9]